MLCLIERQTFTTFVLGRNSPLRLPLDAAHVRRRLRMLVAAHATEAQFQDTIRAMHNNSLNVELLFEALSTEWRANANLNVRP